MTTALPTIARGNPLTLTCTVTDAVTGQAVSGLTVSCMLASVEGATSPIDDALSVPDAEETPVNSGQYAATFTGDDITLKLLGWDYQSVFAIFSCANSGFRLVKEYQVIPGQLG